MTTFISLLRLGIGDRSILPPKGVEWPQVLRMAEEHSLSGVLLDAVDHLPEGERPPMEMLLEWIGQTMVSYESRYEEYRKAIAGLAAWYRAHGYKMMVLKGHTCSLDWPRPEHRPCGDIDIWLFGQQQEADEALSREAGIEIDRTHHHHTVFTWQDFMVENHYDFLNVHHHRSNVAFERILKELGRDDSHWTEVAGERVYLPSPNLHALFLLKHLMGHFAADRITLRQLLDWGFFVKAHGQEVDWDFVQGVLERFGMMGMFHIMNAICVEELGLPGLPGSAARSIGAASVPPAATVDPLLKNRVWNEILSPEFQGTMPARLLPRIVYKFHRWKANGWKHELCYKDTLWSAFWAGVWGHLLKPKSI